MFCARFDHFVRLNADGTIGKCGHMLNGPGFSSWQSMQNSHWLASLRQQMEDDQWPSECQRCKITEQQNINDSVRLASNQRHQILYRLKQDYLILGGVLDNICNSACQSCNATLSTKIGSLHGKPVYRVNNERLLSNVPLERVLEIDLNGGEPSASPNYQNLLDNLPPNTKVIRINTNGSRIMDNIEKILQQGIYVICTLSLDGIGKIHDYVRWPIKWSNYSRVVEHYQNLAESHANLKLQTWTVLHAMNIGDMPNIKKFCHDQNLNHSWAWLKHPAAIDACHTNDFTIKAKEKLSAFDPVTYAPMINYLATSSDNQQILDAFVNQQDTLRQINIKDYL